MNKKIYLLFWRRPWRRLQHSRIRREQEGGIVVLYTNDIHCAVNEDEENQVLGYARTAGLKKQLEAEGNDVILADMGDAIQGDVIGTLSEGEYIIDIMDQVGYDLAVPGNHEFDYEWISSCLLRRKRLFPTCPVTLRI